MSMNMLCAKTGHVEAYCPYSPKVNDSLKIKYKSDEERLKVVTDIYHEECDGCFSKKTTLMQIK